MSRWNRAAVCDIAALAAAWAVCAAALWLCQGCYDAHAAAPCAETSEAKTKSASYASPRWSGAAGSAVAEGPALYPGPCPFAYDHVHCWCVDATHEVCGAPCAGPVVAGECYADLEDWLGR